MGGGKSERVETEAERALAQVALARFNDYKARWEPMIARTAELVTSLREPTSVERERARGRAATEANVRFGRAEEEMEAGLQGRGIGAASSAFRLGKVNLGTDLARSRGLSVAGADQAIDQAYVEGLTSLMALGRGKEAMASTALQRHAAAQAKQAEAEADVAAAERANRAGLVGTAAGFGLDRFINRPSSLQNGANVSPLGWFGYGSLQ